MRTIETTSVEILRILENGTPLKTEDILKNLKELYVGAIGEARQPMLDCFIYGLFLHCRLGLGLVTNELKYLKARGDVVGCSNTTGNGRPRERSAVFFWTITSSGAQRVKSWQSRLQAA